MKKSLLAVTITGAFSFNAIANQATPHFSDDWVERAVQEKTVQASYHAIAASIKDDEARQAVQTYIAGGDHKAKKEAGASFVKAIANGDISPAQVEELDGYYVKVRGDGAQGLSSSLIADGISHLKSTGEINGTEKIEIGGKHYSLNDIAQAAQTNTNKKFEDVMDSNNDFFKKVNAETITIHETELRGKFITDTGDGRVVITDEEGNYFGEFSDNQDGTIEWNAGDYPDAPEGSVTIDPETGRAELRYEDGNGNLVKEYFDIEYNDDTANWKPNNDVIDDTTTNHWDKLRRDEAINNIKNELKQAGIDAGKFIEQAVKDLDSAGIEIADAAAVIEQEIAKAGGDIDKAAIAVEKEFERQAAENKANRDAIAKIEKELKQAGIDADKFIEQAGKDLDSAGIEIADAAAVIEQEIAKAGGDIDKAAIAVEKEFERQAAENKANRDAIAKIEKELEKAGVDIEDAAKRIEEDAEGFQKDLNEWYAQQSKEAQSEIDAAAKYIEGKIDDGGRAIEDGQQWAQHFEAQYKQDIARLDNKIDRVEGRVSNGVAMTGAMSQMQFNSSGLGVGVGLANFNGSNAFALGMGKVAGKNKEWMIRASFGYAQSDKGGDTQRDTMAAAGVTYAFN
ncbi:hypothetical protein F9L16_10065 [Agarivorans sp. B2Z047]|uniref:YadA C-terminal domain-containing protein n=1 Tax=Agarivorans sp. B2Z047 TaxID=2652721 RepID=UPI00128E2B9B|nr:YadA C-terminal domain-containing protein [Agarivorans sp. B2Z047]MPW29342.1 hypothetical protein [Agarivorans sp. B2Z047]UQN44928.1 YadA-like family protein [Agarivorans sp. B2Z047]